MATTNQDGAADAPAGPPQPDATERPDLPIDTVLAYLAANPNVDALLEAHPELSLDVVQACLAQARTLARRASRPGRAAARSAAALPEPDPAIHKLQIFRALLAPLKAGRLLDLGAGRGNFSLAAAELGWEVTAVDARTVRLPDPDAESDPARAERIRKIRWVQADVRGFPIAPGEYDLICVLGLLHHLEVPDQIGLLKRCAGTLTLLDTRVVAEGVDRVDQYEGAHQREHGQTREERDRFPTAAWGNAVSFRHTEASLLRLVRDCGFAKLMQMRPPHRRDYTFYLCLPPPRGKRAR